MVLAEVLDRERRDDLLNSGFLSLFWPSALHKPEDAAACDLFASSRNFLAHRRPLAIGLTGRELLGLAVLIGGVFAHPITGSNSLTNVAE